MHKVQISIDPKLNGRSVDHDIMVRGRIYPPNALVQVLVHSNDNKFYLQKDARVHGRHWEVDTCAGFDDDRTATGSEFTIFAVTGPRKITLSPLEAIPDTHTASSPIQVTRK